MKTLAVRSLSAEDAFQRFLTISVAVHFVIFFGVSLKNMLLPSDTILLQNAVRVDMVALPDKLPQQSEAEAKPAPQPKPVAEKPAPPKPEPPAPKSVNLNRDTKKAQQDALNKLKQRQAMERLKQQANSQAQAPARKKNLYVGNQISPGDSISGLERIAVDEYKSLLQRRVNDNFTLPAWLANSQLQASVEVVIDDAGKLMKISLVKGSGNPTFDSAAMQAVEASVPFPPVPERLKRAWSSFTIQFNFPAT